MALSTATAIATIKDGQVTSVTVTNPGAGYTQTPNVIISGGGGAGAVVLAGVANQSVVGFKVIAGGRGYTSTPDVTISLDSGEALLTYRILTNPDPLEIPQSSTQTSKLSLNVSSMLSVLVDCTSIVVTLPGPGQLAQYLTNSFTGIGVQVPVDGNQNPLWISSQNNGAFTLTPVNAAAGQIGPNGLTFEFSNILVNDSVGSCAVSITETAFSPTTPSGARRAPRIVLSKWPSQFSISDPTATPVSVPYGQSTNVAWSVTGAGVTTLLTYDPDGQGLQTFPVKNVGSKLAANLTNPRGVTFTVQASVPDPGHSQPLTRQKQISVDVIPNPTVDFTITANPVVPGKPLTFTLAWNVEDVASFQITANDGPNGNTYVLPVPFSNQGTYVVTPHQLQVTYTFQVLSTGSGVVRASAGHPLRRAVSPGGPEELVKAVSTSPAVSATIISFAIGTIVPYAFDPSHAPSGWLWCNGSNFDQTQYPDLYKLMGNSNVLPDLRGYFLRGLDSTGKVDPDGPGRSLRSVQADLVGAHQHTFNRVLWYASEIQGGDNRYSEKSSTDSFSHNEPTSMAGGAETRPKNAAVHYLIYAGLQVS